MKFALSVDPGALHSFFEFAAVRVRLGTQNQYLNRGAKEASEIYLAEQRRNFAAEGKDRWRELAKVTQQERTRLGFPAAHPILKRLGILEAGLTPGMPGNVFERLPDGYRMGYGGPFMHPGYQTKSGKRTKPVRLADIAAYHNNGTSKMVRRQILHNATDATLTQMQARMSDGLHSLLVSCVVDARNHPIKRTRAA